MEAALQILRLKDIMSFIRVQLQLVDSLVSWLYR